MIAPWGWIQVSPESLIAGCWELRAGARRNRATIWKNAPGRYTWHTWDDRGNGGENSEASTLNQAKDQCVAAIVRQGWAPGGWEVHW